jgi:hypothetical protein
MLDFLENNTHRSHGWDFLICILIFTSNGHHKIWKCPTTRLIHKEYPESMPQNSCVTYSWPMQYSLLGSHSKGICHHLSIVLSQPCHLGVTTQAPSLALWDLGLQHVLCRGAPTRALYTTPSLTSWPHPRSSCHSGIPLPKQVPCPKTATTEAGCNKPNFS